MVFSFERWRMAVWSAGIMALALLLALSVHFFLFRLARRLPKESMLARALRYCERPVGFILFLTLEIAALSFLPVTDHLKHILRHALGVCLIAGVAWLIIAMVDLVGAALGHKYSPDVTDDLAARRVRTQVLVLRRIIVVLIIVMTVAGVLMTFPSIRHIGESLYATAGLAAVVAGLATRTMLSNLLAGVQIALTQPFRLVDVVIVEG